MTGEDRTSPPRPARLAPGLDPQRPSQGSRSPRTPPGGVRSQQAKTVSLSPAPTLIVTYRRTAPPVVKPHRSVFFRSVAPMRAERNGWKPLGQQQAHDAVHVTVARRRAETGGRRFAQSPVRLDARHEPRIGERKGGCCGLRNHVECSPGVSPPGSLVEKTVGAAIGGDMGLASSMRTGQRVPSDLLIG
jgi:hypothetical protein